MKKLLRYLPFYLLLCVIVGILLEYYFNVWKHHSKILILLQGILVLSISISYFFKRKTIFKIVTPFIFIIFGIYSTYSSDSKNNKNYYDKFHHKNSLIFLTINERLKSTNYYHKYKANVIQIDSIITSGKILLNVKKDSLKPYLITDDLITLKTDLIEIPPPLNPNQFHYKNYLLNKGIKHQIFIKNNEFKTLKNKTSTLKGYLNKIRLNIQKRLSENNFSKHELDIINTILLGDKRQTSKELKNSYAKAGVIHILAISGLHIGILFFILSYIFTPIKYCKHGDNIHIIIVVCLLWTFAFFTGLSASVVRAVTMFSFIAFGNFLKRNNAIEHSLIASLFFILLIHPIFLFDVGFQLSYIAVFSIIYIQPLFLKLWLPKNKIIKKIWQLSSVSLAAQIGILPISLFYFHQFPSLFLISNLVIIPFISFILISGFLIIFLILINQIPSFIISFYSFILKSMNQFVFWISNQETFLFTNISMSFLAMITWYMFLIFLFQLIKKKKVKYLICFLTSIFCIQFIYLKEEYTNTQKRELIVFHKNKNSLVILRQNKTLNIIKNSSQKLSLDKKHILNPYNNYKEILLNKDKNENSLFKFNNNIILFIDSLGVHPKTKLINPIVILQHSPKLNLNRLLKELKPKLIIADGSNYKTYVAYWKKTCKKQKTPFHYTSENGAYIMKY